MEESFNPRSVWLKEKCPRPHCGGNLHLEYEGYGRVVKKCLLCGRTERVKNKKHAPSKISEAVHG